MTIDLNAALSALISIGLKIILAFIIFAIGRWLAGFAARWVRRTLDKRKADEAVARMATTLTRIAMLVLTIGVILGVLGIQATVMAALVAVLGVAIGLALQGALANFAGGVLILTFHPFRIGDLVEIAGSTGVVEDIQIVATVLLAADNSRIILPNGEVTSDKIVNYSSTGIRRVDLLFGIAYEDDLLKAKRILTELVTSHALVLTDPPATVRVLELDDSSVNFAVRPFAKIDDYWDVYFDLTEQVKLAFDREGITIPFPQQSVRVIQAG